MVQYSESASPRRRIRVIVVEDEAVIALDLTALLQGWGYDVVGSAATGPAALSLARAQEVDVALLDIRLRGPMDGVEVGRILQEEFDVALVFLTAYADSPALRRAGALHPVGYLLKPVDQPLLSATLELARHRREMELERRRLREREERSQALLTELMDGCPDAMLAVDRRGVLVQLNKRASTLADGTVESLLGQTLEVATGLGFDDVREAAERGERYETRLRPASGRELPVEVSVAPVEAGGGLVYSLVVRDVSEVRAEQARRDRRNRLEASGRLAAGITHDLSGLLTVMKCSAFLIRERAEADTAEEAKQLDEAIARGSALLGVLLGFARGGDREFEIVDVGELVERMQPVLRHAVGPRARLAVTVAPGVAVLGNALRLEQLLLNLVFNAGDAVGPDGEVGVVVGRATVDEPRRLSGGPLGAGEYAEIRVVDDGTGISPDVLPRVFDPFFSTKFEKQGSGLGLVTVLDVVDEHEGQIDLLSKVGAGTSIGVFLPIFPDTDAELEGAEVHAEAQPLEGDQGPWRLLFVDDDIAALEPVVAWFSERGHQVIGCSGAHAALDEVTRRGDVDCIISDVAMRGLDGPSLRAAMDRAGHRVPFVYVTGHHRESLETMGIDVPEEVVVKPVHEPRLLAAVRRTLARQRGES